MIINMKPTIINPLTEEQIKSEILKDNKDISDISEVTKEMIKAFQSGFNLGSLSTTSNIFTIVNNEIKNKNESN